MLSLDGTKKTRKKHKMWTAHNAPHDIIVHLVSHA